MTAPSPEAPALSSARKWAITISVMVVAFMQILDPSVANVILPHLQGSMSAGLEEVSWVITSYLAANAIVIPAAGWLARLFGRWRFFLICTTLFAASSFLSGAAPDLTTLIVARIFQGIGAGPSSLCPRRSSGRSSLSASGASPWRYGHRLHPGADRRRLPGRRVVLAVDLLHQPARRVRGLHPGQEGSRHERRSVAVARPWPLFRSLTSLQRRLFKTGGRLIRHARYFILQLAESYLTGRLFRQILGRIEGLAWHPT